MHTNFQQILGKILSNETKSIDSFIFLTPFAVYITNFWDKIHILKGLKAKGKVKMYFKPKYLSKYHWDKKG